MVKKKGKADWHLATKKKDTPKKRRKTSARLDRKSAWAK